MKKDAKVKLAYEFLLQQETLNQSFSLQQLTEVTGWKISTIETYINKQWRSFLIFERNKYRCNGLNLISQQEFIKLNSQKKYKEYANEVELLIKKARHFALLAIFVYNNPYSEFRIHGYIVNIVIAWTALFHAFFESKNIDYFHKDKAGNNKILDGQKKTWELSQCLKEYYKSNNSDVRQNLNLLIKLRNPIEHSSLPFIDILVAGYCQASLTNFEEFLVEHFGGEYAIQTGLSISLQLSKVSQEHTEKALKILQTEQYKIIKDQIAIQEGMLSNEILNSQKYKVRLLVIPNLVRNPNTADQIIEFVKLDPSNIEDVNKISRCVDIFNEKTKFVEKLEHELRPGQVIERVSEKIGRKFTMTEHTNSWKKYNVRPKVKEENWKSKYCVWSKLTNQYLYSETWVEHLINENK